MCRKMNPYSTEKYWNTYLKPEEVADNVKKKKAKKFKYIYKYDRNNLDLMFSNIDDTTQTMDAIINYIMAGQGMFKDNLAKEWEEKFWSLPADKLKTVQEIVALNQFKELDMSQYDEQVRDVLTYYQFTRDEAEELIKQSKTE